MAKITRKFMKIFGQSAGSQQIGEFGSLAAGSVAYTTDPEVVQGLANYLVGWYAAVVGSNSPAIQDMNALFFLYAYQLAYIMQQGVPEWNSSTTYYIGSLVNDSNGVLYISLTNTNLNNALTDVTNWQLANTGAVKTITGTTTVAQGDGFLRGNTTGGAFTATLPASASTPIGKQYVFKNVGTVPGQLFTVKGNAAELIDASNTVDLDCWPVRDSITVSNNPTQTGWDII